MLMACEKEIKINQNEYAPKAVLNCLLNPDKDTVWAKLSESRDMLYDKYDFPSIDDATIKLYDNNVNIGIFTFSGEGQYFLPYTVLAEHTYKIEITNTKFNDLTASTVVPNPGVISSISVDLTVVNADLNADISIVFQDNGNEQNFYGVEVSRIDTNKYEPIPSYTGYEYHPPYPNRYFCTKDLIVEYPQSEMDVENCADLMLFSDNTFNGNSYNFKCNNTYSYYGEISDTMFYTKIKVIFKTYNEDYYKYALSTKLAQDNYGNPFAEPVRIYNNVEGGFGIFGSLNTIIDSLEFN
jgi:hypothetical protein